MKKLKVHGKLLEKYIEESGKASVLLQIKEKYELWANAKDSNALKKKFIEYDEFFNSHFQEIREAISSERKFSAFIGHRLEEFVYLLLYETCKQKSVILDKISPGNIITWIGFNENGNLSAVGHGTDLVIGNWKKLTIKNGVGIGIEEKEYFIPKIIIECKQYVSLDMFRDIVTESEMFKRIYPYSLFVIVCEVIEMTDEFRKMKKVWEAYIDGFFAFRPGNRRNPGKLILENINNFEKTIIDFIQKL
jgi:hypothetical protein